MTASIYYDYIESPLGRLFVQGDGQFVTGLFLPQHKRRPLLDASWRQSNALFAVVREQLSEYFAGDRQAFDLPLNLVGGPFQQRVWQELVRIPFGTTITYGQLAQRLGHPSAARAVGYANSRNPISIIVPCHRVIGSNGRLTGYAGGVDNKQWLLDWEGRTAFRQLGLTFHDQSAAQCFPHNKSLCASAAIADHAACSVSESATLCVALDNARR